MQRSVTFALSLALLCASSLLASQAAASGYPLRPVRWIIGYPPGGASDVLVRLLANRLADGWGQQVVVDNRPGAAGIIAAETAAKATPDGHTIFLGDISTHAINRSLYRKLPYDPIADFAPVSRVGDVPNIVVVGPSLAARSMPDLIKMAKAKPGQVNYASGGNGTGTHLATELFKSLTSAEMSHVPYKGTPPALIDLAAGAVQVMFAGAPPALPFVQSGKLRAIAVTSRERFSLLPAVPTVAETLPGYEATTWYGVFVPKRTPPSIVAALNKSLVEVLGSGDVKERLMTLGFTVISSTPEQLGTFVAQETDKYAKVVRERGLRLD